MPVKYLQTTKTISNILKRHGVKKDEPNVIEWDELTWDDKKSIFESHYPTEDTVNQGEPTYYLGDFPSLRQTQPENPKWMGGTLVWVLLDRNFTPEFFFWLVFEKMKGDEDYLKTILREVSYVQNRLIDKQIQEKVNELTKLHFRKLPSDQQDDETFDKIYEQVKSILELEQE